MSKSFVFRHYQPEADLKAKRKSTHPHRGSTRN